MSLTFSTKNPYREQLEKLPEVFTLPETRRILGYSPTTANQTLSRWMEKGLIDALAPRSGVYFNLEKNKYAREQNLRLAITKKYPVSRIIGPHVLVNYGWTTQIQQYMTLALNLPPIKGSTSSTNGYLSVPEVEFQYRSKKWWQAAIVDEAKRNKKNIYIQGFESVSPGFALVDMWMNKDLSWFPDADDLHLEDAPDAAQDILQACKLLGVDPDPLFAAIEVDPYYLGLSDSPFCP